MTIYFVTACSLYLIYVIIFDFLIYMHRLFFFSTLHFSCILYTVQEILLKTCSLYYDGCYKTVMLYPHKKDCSD